MQTRDAEKLINLQAAVGLSLEKFKNAFRQHALIDLSSDDINLSHQMVERMNQILNFKLAPSDTLAILLILYHIIKKI
jgi:hypothetical protein